MGILGQIDIELQKDLLDFIKAQEQKPYPHVLRDSLLAMALREIIDGNARISGWAKNDSKRPFILNSLSGKTRRLKKVIMKAVKGANADVR